MSFKENVEHGVSSQTDSCDTVCSSVQTDIGELDLRNLIKMNESKSDQIRQQEKLISNLLLVAQNLQTQSDSFKKRIEEMTSTIDNLTKENDQLKRQAKQCFGYKFI